MVQRLTLAADTTKILLSSAYPLPRTREGDLTTRDAESLEKAGTDCALENKQKKTRMCKKKPFVTTVMSKVKPRSIIRVVLPGLFPPDS